MSAPKILKSWKAIASYLGVGVRTAQRWQRERSLPVKKPGATRNSTVLGFPDEIDRWLRDASGTSAMGEAERPELADIVATDLLWTRRSRPMRLESEVAVLLELGHLIADQDRGKLLSRISTLALELCKAESSGFSILDTAENGKEIFR